MAEQVSNSGQVEASPSRPIIITILCIFGFIGAPAGLYLMFTETARGIAPWYPALLGVSVVIGLVCMIGLWMMRKWAVYAYTAFAAVNQVVLLATGIWNLGALIIPAIFIIVMFIYLSRMR